MDVWSETRQRLSWLRGLIKRVNRLAAVDFWLAVGLVVLGQLAFLLTLFLPFQVMVMLATRTPTRYWGWTSPALPLETVVVGLLCLTLALYLLYLACGRWAAARMRSAAQRVLAQGHKLALFKDDRQQALAVVQRLVSWCVGGLLCLVYGGLGLWVDGPVFAVVLAVALLLYGLVCVVLRHLDAAQTRAVRWVVGHRTRAFAMLNNSLFFAGFLGLFLQFLHAGQGELTTAALALLLLRQMTERLSQWALGLWALPELRHRANVLFDPDQPYTPPPAAPLQRFVALLAPEQRDAWLRRAIQVVTGHPCDAPLAVRWNDTSWAGLAAFDVSLQAGTAAGVASEGAWFVRCFAPDKGQPAAHEASLFESHTPPPLAPHYLGRTQVHDIDVLVFAGLPSQRPPSGDLVALRRQLHQACAAITIDTPLASAYRRTHATLPHRLDPLLIKRLRAAAADAAQREAIDRLAQALPELCPWLGDLPCVLENPDTAAAFIRVDAQGQPVFWQWQRWRADLAHPHVVWTEPEPRALASAVARLELAVRSGRPAEALGKLPDVLALWGRCRERVSGSGTGSIECLDTQTVKNTT